MPNAPDPKLVRYLRANLKRFSAKDLRENLLKEGLGTEDVDAALAAASQQPLARRLRTPLLLAVGSLLVLAGLFALLPSHPSAPGTRPLSTAPDVSGHPNAGGASRLYIGRSNYVFQLPMNYSAASEFKDLQKTQETVYLAPAGTDPTNFGNEGIYGPLGILRLEISPRRIPEGRITLESVRTGVARTLQNKKVLFTTRETQIAGLQALIVGIGQPFPLTQAFVLGDKQLYVLSGGAEDDAFTGVLQSLREGPP